jgi:hypothetical protein
METGSNAYSSRCDTGIFFMPATDILSVNKLVIVMTGGS